jgi:hypothetical protein
LPSSLWSVLMSLTDRAVADGIFGIKQALSRRSEGICPKGRS